MSVTAGSDLNGRDFQNIINDVGLSHSEAAELAESLLAGSSQLHGWTGGEDGVSGWGADLTQRFFSRLKHDLLSKEEEIELGLIIRKGREAENQLTELIDQLHLLEPLERMELKRSVRRGNDARDKFINSNLRLARSIAVRYVSIPGHRLTIDDLFQECFFGLNRAVDLWDPDRGFRFSTYAVNWIRQTLSRSIANQGRTIRLPVHVREQLRKLQIVTNRFESEHHRTPSVDELANIDGESVAVIAFLRSLCDDAELIEWPEGLDRLDGEVDLFPWISDGGHWSGALEYYASEITRSALNDSLNEREKEVLLRRFGFGGKDPQTLEAIGKDFRLTRERVRQIEAKAYEKLKTSSYGPELAQLIESNFYSDKLQADNGTVSSEPACS